jgi:HEPN domain-containing protein
LSEIRKLQEQIASSYKAIENREIVLPASIQVDNWVHFAREYIAAATLVAEQSPYNVWPRLQMTGQAVESSLKACLTAARAETPIDHDLVRHYELAEGHGFRLGRFAMAALVHLGHFYFQDVATGTKFKIRYPTKKTERLGGAVPENASYVSIVQDLCDQAIRRNKSNVPE